MTAIDVEVGDWFMVNANHKWYKKEEDGKHHIKSSQIGSPATFLIANEEPVIVRK